MWRELGGMKPPHDRASTVPPERARHLERLRDELMRSRSPIGEIRGRESTYLASFACGRVPGTRGCVHTQRFLLHVSERLGTFFRLGT